mmetsp:Transcript_42021/g.121845  ORF Transcript_42021/g.121845 Transcript_42021/m.121845 type:complete len:219 (-) Transcript_42021:13-669(-)
MLQLHRLERHNEGQAVDHGHGQRHSEVSHLLVEPVVAPHDPEGGVEGPLRRRRADAGQGELRGGEHAAHVHGDDAAGRGVVPRAPYMRRHVPDSISCLRRDGLRRRHPAHGAGDRSGGDDAARHAEAAADEVRIAPHSHKGRAVARRPVRRRSHDESPLLGGVRAELKQRRGVVGVIDMTVAPASRILRGGGGGHEATREDQREHGARRNVQGSLPGG